MMVGGDGMGWLPLVGREGECLGQSEGWNWQEAHTLPDSLSSSLVPKNISPPQAFHPPVFLLDSPLAGSPKKDLRPRCAGNNKVGEEYLIWEQIDIDTAGFPFSMNSTFVKIKLMQNIALNLIT